MINVPVGEETFYDVAKRKEAERRAERLASARAQARREEGRPDAPDDS